MVDVINEKKLVKRSEKVSYYKPKGAETFHRMKGFTSLSTSKNPKEYTRQYVDEEFETTDVVGLSTSMEFGFDQMKNDPVHEDAVKIIDNEITGTDAVRELLVVDFTDGDEVTGFAARSRKYSLIPSTEGGSLEAYTYEGTFKVNSKTVLGTATSKDDWLTCEFKPKTGVESEEWIGNTEEKSESEKPKTVDEETEKPTDIENEL